MSVWAWMYGVFWLAPTRPEKLFWLSLAFIGVVIVSPAFLVMAIQFSGKTNWPTRRSYVLLAILPSLVLFSELIFRFDNTTFQTTLSIGVASYPAHEKSVDKLLLAADKAMYFSKIERNQISEYVPAMNNSEN